MSSPLADVHSYTPLENEESLPSVSSKKLVSALWSNRNYRRQTFISDSYHVEISEAINKQEMSRTEVNNICGNEKTQSVAPIMELRFENGQTNSVCLSNHANQHDTTLKEFASSLVCLIGKSGYELLLTNLVSALPSMTSIQRMVANRKKIKAGEFQYDELSDHLKDFNSPRFVNIHLDNTRIIHRVESRVRSSYRSVCGFLFACERWTPTVWCVRFPHL